MDTPTKLIDLRTGDGVRIVDLRPPLYFLERDSIIEAQWIEINVGPFGAVALRVGPSSHDPAHLFQSKAAATLHLARIKAHEAQELARKAEELLAAETRAKEPRSEEDDTPLVPAFPEAAEPAF